MSSFLPSQAANPNCRSHWWQVRRTHFAKGERCDDNNENTLHPISTHTNTHKYAQHRHVTLLLNTSPSPPQLQAHFTPSGTRLAQEYQDKYFLHDANMFAQQGMGQGTCTLALRASQGRAYRESQLDECSLSSSLSRERKSRQERDTCEKREREMKRDRDRDAKKER